MRSVTLTARAAREAGACRKSYRKFAQHKGGVRRWGADKPFALLEVLDVMGLSDALWCLDNCCPDAWRLRLSYRADVAERGLPVYEKFHPEDGRPRAEVDAMRARARGEITQEQLDAAEGATRAAFVEAACVAIKNPARAAAWAAEARAAISRWAAERQWRAERLRWYLEGGEASREAG